MNSFALFRLPYEQVVTRVVQHDRQPVAGQVFSDVYRQKGFVFAPFAVSDDCPLLLIRADEMRRAAAAIFIGRTVIVVILLALFVGASPDHVLPTVAAADQSGEDIRLPLV